MSVASGTTAWLLVEPGGTAPPARAHGQLNVPLCPVPRSITVPSLMFAPFWAQCLWWDRLGKLFISKSEC